MAERYRAIRQPRRSFDADQNPAEEDQPRQAEWPAEATAAVVGADPLPRGEVVSKVWAYIRAHHLQNPENRREILADDKLRLVFDKDKVTMFEINKHLAAHLT